MLGGSSGKYETYISNAPESVWTYGRNIDKDGKSTSYQLYQRSSKFPTNDSSSNSNAIIFYKKCEYNHFSLLMVYDGKLFCSKKVYAVNSYIISTKLVKW